MKIRNIAASAMATVAALAAVAPATSLAETPDEWRYAATIYVWMPSIGMDTSYPADSGTSVDVTASDILDALSFAFMGAFAAQKGDWGLATDINYLDLSSSTKKTGFLSVGGEDLGAVTGKADLSVTGWLWTTVGSYRVVDKPDYTMDVVAGVRMLNLSSDLKWSLTGDLGDPPIIESSGKGNVSDTVWDGIVGVKGRATFGADKKWFVPYYIDVGTGDSDLTWLGMLGAGYSFGWGDVEGVWRYLDYNMPSQDPIQNLNFNGPAIGVTFHF